MSHRKFFAVYVLMCFLMNATLKADIPYSLDPLLNYKQTVQGFSCSLFWNSMKWQREDTDSQFMDDKDVKMVEQNYIQFCQNFKELPTHDYSRPPIKFSIPPIIHFIWLGSQAPAKVTAAFDSWRKHHPGWEVKIWTEQTLAGFLWSNQRVCQAFEQAVTWAEKADILRIEVLYKFGGSIAMPMWFVSTLFKT